MRKFMRKVSKKFRYGEKGFTLIELLIVIAILGVLAAVVVPNVARFTQSGQKAAAQQELGTVQTAIDAAMAEAGVVALTVDIVLVAGDPTGQGQINTSGVFAGDFLRRDLEGWWEVIEATSDDGLISKGHYKEGQDPGWTYDGVADTWAWENDPDPS